MFIKTNLTGDFLYNSTTLIEMHCLDRSMLVCSYR